jgi:hypothetical protein
VLALPCCTSEKRALAQCCSVRIPSETETHLSRRGEPSTGKLAHRDMQIEVVRENGLQPLRRAALLSK